MRVAGINKDYTDDKIQYLILAILVVVPCLYASVQEIYAIPGPHDDYYFVQRSSAFKLMGSHLAPIKEYLYSIFVGFSRTIGFSVRTYEVVCYGLALYYLYLQILGLQKSRVIAFCAVFPLSLFVYQHPVFNRATYDALQLILTPLSIGSALQIVSKRGGSCSIVTASLVAGCQILTRPEGSLFLAPPLIALLLVGGRAAFRVGKDGKRFLYQVALLLLFPVLFQQGISAINNFSFGFWAPTIMKSGDFQSAISALMSIDPIDGRSDAYTPFPKAAMQLAYEVSPEFRKAKPYFDGNIDNTGWSKYAILGYRAEDGSISGGHFQWALLDASAFVAGPKPEAMLSYLRLVAMEINAGFEKGAIRRRLLISSALGPDFSVHSYRFWSSLHRLGSILVGYAPPVLPSLPAVIAPRRIEADFDRLLLRRTDLVGITGWKVSGWLLDSNLGVPSNIRIDRKALQAGIQFNLIQRPDVARVVLGLTGESPPCLCGIEVSSPGPSVGSLIVSYGDRTTEISIDKLKVAKVGTSLDLQGVHIQVDSRVDSKHGFQLAHFAFVSWITIKIQEAMKLVVPTASLYLIAHVVCRRRLVTDNYDRLVLAVLACVTLSVALPRWGLLSAIDSVMYPGDEPRYLSAAAFSVWVISWFAIACAVRDASVILGPKFRKIAPGLLVNHLRKVDPRW